MTIEITIEGRVANVILFGGFVYKQLQLNQANPTKTEIQKKQKIMGT